MSAIRVFRAQLRLASASAAAVPPTASVSGKVFGGEGFMKVIIFVEFLVVVLLWAQEEADVGFGYSVNAGFVILGYGIGH